MSSGEYPSTANSGSDGKMPTKRPGPIGSASNFKSRARIRSMSRFIEKPRPRQIEQSHAPRRPSSETDERGQYQGTGFRRASGSHRTAQPRSAGKRGRRDRRPSSPAFIAAMVGAVTGIFAGMGAAEVEIAATESALTDDFRKLLTECLPLGRRVINQRQLFHPSY